MHYKSSFNEFIKIIPDIEYTTYIKLIKAYFAGHTQLLLRNFGAGEATKVNILDIYKISPRIISMTKQYTDLRGLHAYHLDILNKSISDIKIIRISSTLAKYEEELIETHPNQSNQKLAILLKLRECLSIHKKSSHLSRSFEAYRTMSVYNRYFQFEYNISMYEYCLEYELELTTVLAAVISNNKILAGDRTNPNMQWIGEHMIVLSKYTLKDIQAKLRRIHVIKPIVIKNRIYSCKAAYNSLNRNSWTISK